MAMIHKPGPEHPLYKAVRKAKDAYQSAHNHCTAVRGKASLYPCVACGGVALDWAIKAESERLGETLIVPYQGGFAEVSTSVWDYEPKCRLDHLAEDRRRREMFVALWEDVLDETDNTCG